MTFQPEGLQQLSHVGSYLLNLYARGGVWCDKSAKDAFAVIAGICGSRVVGLYLKRQPASSTPKVMIPLILAISLVQDKEAQFESRKRSIRLTVEHSVNIKKERVWFKIQACLAAGAIAGPLQGFQGGLVNPR